MKSIYWIGGLMGLGLLSSCDKLNVLGSLDATIDGVAWESSTQLGRKEGDTLIIAGIKDGANLSMAMPDQQGTINMGNFSFQGFAPFVYIPDTSDVTNTYLGISGTITLSARSQTRASGSFNVSAANVNPITPDTMAISGEFSNILIP
jgi:hypothetical protein